MANHIGPIRTVSSHSGRHSITVSSWEFWTSTLKVTARITAMETVCTYLTWVSVESYYVSHEWTWTVFPSFQQETPVPDEVKIPGPGAIIGQFCGIIRNSTTPIRSSKNVLTVLWHTEANVRRSDDHRNPTGFRLMWTVFRDVDVVKQGEKLNTVASWHSLIV